VQRPSSPNPETRPRPTARPPPGNAEDAVVEAAKGGDEAAFAELVGRYRRELHVHCYRMLGSFEEAEDLVQETFLRLAQA
jgi:DNA-directed RNA polymerase specialized sigma24 family protein